MGAIAEARRRGKGTREAKRRDTNHVADTCFHDNHYGKRNREARGRGKGTREARRRGNANRKARRRGKGAREARGRCTKAVADTCFLDSHYAKRNREAPAWFCHIGSSRDVVESKSHVNGRYNRLSFASLFVWSGGFPLGSPFASPFAKKGGEIESASL